MNSTISEFVVIFTTQWINQMSAITWVAAFFLVWLLLWLPIAIPLMRRLQWQPFQPFTPAQKLPLLASLYAIAPLLLWGYTVLAQVPFTHYGLRWQPSVLLSISVGIGIAVLGLLLLFGLQQWQTWSLWQSAATVAFRNALLPSFLIGLWVSITEELVFRGFLLNQLLTLFPAWGAAVGVSAIFAVLHLLWDRQETIPQLPGLWLMGMVLVLARWADQGLLGLAIGLHAGWVGSMISLDSSQVIQYSDRAPVWFTGVFHKPLAGWGGILLLMLTGAVVGAIGWIN
ncbi:MAG: CPBP family intramembrane glutamic endopeptidase [Leptolyngbyaceae cyanobacterium bins.349]|nr:CPBP family intramembrane glutamic endopeptidase [Leptolyngbyaceae cyanobacterium bins.349]